ncbi:hypothetical protein [Paraburkholderia tropica]|uniref:hypothetical protein n=1 Tax=Paraburkholderia tropica TaxID=92647 RepID=UPI001590DC0D|nr:hypothetical protein [Paraburkholderia tropica]
MHTHSLLPSMFSVQLSGGPAGLESLFPSWNRYDRIGFVIQEPWGAGGASLLIQAAIAEFYRARRAEGIKDIYPEVYAFHVGKDFGDMSNFDTWPFTKEVFVESHPENVLMAINDRAITRLFVPDGEKKPFEFVFPEVIAFEDRIRSVFAYSLDGNVAGADVTISSDSPEVEDNTQGVFDIMNIVARYRHLDLPDPKRWIGHVERRLNVTTEQELARAKRIHDAKIVNGVTTESFRREDTKFALDRLIA